MHSCMHPYKMYIYIRYIYVQTSYIHAHAWYRDLLWIPLSYKFLWEWWLEIFLIFVKARIVYVCLKTKKVKEYTSFTFHRHCTITNIIQTIIESLLSKSFPSWWVNRETAGVANSIRSIKVCLIDRTLVVHIPNVCVWLLS